MKSRIRPALVSLLWLAAAACDDDPSQPNDVTSPRRVTNLAVVGAAPDSIRLQWTAPGDDGGTGTADRYQIRWSLAPINAANFGTATAVPNPPAPMPGGTLQQFTVAGIDTTRETHFALRAFDEADNVSQVSNNATWAPPLPQLVKDIAAFKDNTMYEESDTLSNGQGAYLFTGRTLGLIGSAANRRALLAFAVVDSLPAGAVIDSVQLMLFVSKVPNLTPQTASLHRVTTDWGEGASDAGEPGGMGAPAQSGDATWTFRFFDTSNWTTPGGAFVATASAQATLGGFNTVSTWSSAQMTADVQGWLDTPATNFGWIVVGDETAVQTARRLNAREHPTATTRPQLRVYYTVPP